MERVVTIRVKGDFTDRKDPHDLTDMLNDAIHRESGTLSAGGFNILSVESEVTVPADSDGRALDPRTGIEDVGRICNDCHEPLGYTHTSSCSIGSGQVELAQTIAD